MKKKALFGLAFSALFGATALIGGSALGTFAAGGEVSPNAGDLIQWEASAEWVPEGLQLEMGQWKSGAFQMFFDVSNGKKFSMKFKLPVYQEDSSNYIEEDGVTYEKDLCDIIVRPNGKSTPTAQFRLWGDSGKDASSVNISAEISVGEPYEDEWNPAPRYIANNVWVKGVMRQSSEFYLEFDPVNFFTSYWGQDEDTCALLDHADVGNAAAVKAKLQEEFAGCEAVQVNFRLSKDKGTDDKTHLGRVIVTELNGQSLANTDGKLNDTVAPFLAPVQVRTGAEVTLGKEYGLEILGAPSEQPTQPLYCGYVSDVLGYEAKLNGHGHFTYSAEITSPSNVKKTVDVDKIVFDEVGENKIKVTVTDEGGNSHTTPETTVTVAKGFLLTVTGVPTTGTVGTKIALPAGSATDSKDNACTVTISVEDPYTKKYDVKDGGFTPDKPGAWIVTYSSQNEDGTEHDSKQFRITVSAAPAGEEKKGCGGTIAGIGVAAVGAVGAGAAAIVLRKKRK